MYACLWVEPAILFCQITTSKFIFYQKIWIIGAEMLKIFTVMAWGLRNIRVYIWHDINFSLDPITLELLYDYSNKYRFNTYFYHMITISASRWNNSNITAAFLFFFTSQNDKDTIRTFYGAAKTLMTIGSLSSKLIGCCSFLLLVRNQNNQGPTSLRRHWTSWL